MKGKRFVQLFLFIFCCLVISPGCSKKNDKSFLGIGSYAGDYWPTTTWRTCVPEGVGMDSDRLYKVSQLFDNQKFTEFALQDRHRSKLGGKCG